MAPPRKQIAPELIAEGRRLYEQTLARVDDIAAMMGISRSWFQQRAREWGWSRRRANAGITDLARVLRSRAVASVTSKAGGKPRNDTPPAGSTTQATALAARIQSVVEREMDAVDRVLNTLGPADQGEAERAARTLASLAKTMREIAALMLPEQVTPPDETDDDSVPRDIDEFRRALARRIDALVDARQHGDSRSGGETIDRAGGEGS